MRFCYKSWFTPALCFVLVNLIHLHSNAGQRAFNYLVHIIVLILAQAAAEHNVRLGIGQCLSRGTLISMFLVMFVLPQILLIGTRIVDRTSFAVPKLVARSSGNGRMRVNGIVQGEIHGSVAGTMNAIVDGDVQLTVISGNVSQELDDNEKQEVQNERTNVFIGTV